MNCQYCNNPIPSGVCNCPSCGAPVPAQMNQPPQQQPMGNPSTPFGAGNTMNQPHLQPFAQYNRQVSQNAKSRIGYILLGLFLGVFGVHNFYAGYTGRGVAQLCITLFLSWLVLPLLIVSIWVLVEICAIGVDSNGVPME